MLCMLEVGFRKDAIPRSCRIPAKLEILFEELLGSSTNSEVRAIAVKHMVAVQRGLGIATAWCPAASTMMPASYTLHIHRPVMHFPDGVPHFCPCRRMRPPLPKRRLSISLWLDTGQPLIRCRLLKDGQQEQLHKEKTAIAASTTECSFLFISTLSL
ncbi:hypothetical protein GFGA_1c1074 [Gluconobacter frateurii NBRC 103465]|nr:hypothetical protein GFGA_1c1074 [Gluconobacter frateurii NBRC 103465]